ncbi:MAG: DUF885 domain-containing protein [bacterium]
MGKTIFYLLVCVPLLACAKKEKKRENTTAEIKKSTPVNATSTPETRTIHYDIQPTADFESLMELPASELGDVVAGYSADRSGLLRRHNLPYSPAQRARLRAFYQGWRLGLDDIEFDSLSIEGRIDYVLMHNQLEYELALLDREEKRFAQMQTYLPFALTVIQLEEARRNMEPVEPEKVAATLDALPDEIEQTRKSIQAWLESDKNGSQLSRIAALNASNALKDLRSRLERWFKYYAGYDPAFTWWVSAPYKKAEKALKSYVSFLNEKVVGFKRGEDPPIVGNPIGAEGLQVALKHEMIPYTPEELIAIAEREFAWCEAEMKKASQEMGFGDNWKEALEKVKTLHVAPGRQPQLVRELALEAVDFLRERDLLTIPPLAEEIWRMQMMSPEMQKISPFFLGGEVILVAFPTDEMAHQDKLMSMRGNNVHFARATVHHELIPGHHLQGFMTRRYNSHRRAFSTPFWGEGWALYWEMFLWDLGFPKSPEDRVGMLFWRSHRAARIIFSLSFHQGAMTPQEAIDFLVEKVGHERANATAEVRRSFNGNYSPLYQAAYMIGGLQIRALHESLVASGKMTDKQFHDAILQGGSMPIEMVRARLTGEAPVKEFQTSWRFYGAPLE